MNRDDRVVNPDATICALTHNLPLQRLPALLDGRSCDRERMAQRGAMRAIDDYAETRHAAAINSQLMNTQIRCRTLRSICISEKDPSRKMNGERCIGAGITRDDRRTVATADRYGIGTGPSRRSPGLP
jgi:hypothetical protein